MPRVAVDLDSDEGLWVGEVQMHRTHIELHGILRAGLKKVPITNDPQEHDLELTVSWRGVRRPLDQQLSKDFHASTSSGPRLLVHQPQLSD